MEYHRNGQKLLCWLLLSSSCFIGEIFVTQNGALATC